MTDYSRLSYMRARPVLMLGIFFLFALSMWMGELQASETDAQKQLSDVATSLTNGSVARIDLLHMPDRIETRAAVTPENLERWTYCRISIHNLSEWAGRDEFVKTMKFTTATASPRMPDIRSAIVLYDSADHRIGVLYFSRFFRAEGAIGRIPASFKGNLPNWLKETIPSSLQ
jgi:hypothetical protein